MFVNKLSIGQTARA